MTVLKTVQTGNYRASLLALRDKLAADIDNPETTPQVRATCVKQMQSVLADIQAIPDSGKYQDTPLDKLLGEET